MSNEIEQWTARMRKWFGGYAVRNVNYFERRSGLAYTADIYHKGRHIGVAENDGDGGADEVFFYDRADHDSYYAEADKLFADDPEPYASLLHSLIDDFEGDSLLHSLIDDFKGECNE